MHNVHISNEMDDLTLQSHIRDTLVLTNPREYPSRHWNLILSLLHHPYLYTVSLTEESNCTNLTNFFKPSSRQYSSIVYSLFNSKKYSSVGLQLIKYLSKMEGILIKDIVDPLGQLTASKVTTDIFSPSSTSHRMSRDYFLLIGAVSFHNSSLLLSLGAYGPILDICSITYRHDLHKLIISSLDFSHDNYSKPILQKLLNGSDGETRLYATKHMQVFLHVNAPFFSN
ncbi:PREDICTED: rapamycin-insensitive companion of mTOR-like [Amphimedon queenslandica]|uniref:Rapamycin-insensitive companion of mTOR middle domain-containing protein n=1 Tax=Amphimedon queenslandica TaxID=400682 RepID=A0AAN0JFE1_AMPQE|nr:PREDICTED: rapamycin-insensitive companion of mTOR-like [Amphimedon queenslandica]|eukprot:XP_019855516.1 PREDICTED: rapamycin-insensitive companion of mTOR-like [Amphimedon queenslandica]